MASPYPIRSGLPPSTVPTGNSGIADLIANLNRIYSTAQAGPSTRDLIDAASKLVDQQQALQRTQISREQQREQQFALSQLQAIRGFSEAAAGEAAKLSPQISADSQGAATVQDALASGYSAGLRLALEHGGLPSEQAAPFEQTTRALGGLIPGGELLARGQAFSNAAALIPAETRAQGLQQQGLASAQSLATQRGLADKIADLDLARPGLVAQAASQLRNQDLAERQVADQRRGQLASQAIKVAEEQGRESRSQSAQAIDLLRSQMAQGGLDRRQRESLKAESIRQQNSLEAASKRQQDSQDALAERQLIAVQASDVRSARSAALADMRSQSSQSGFRYRVIGNPAKGFKAVPVTDAKGNLIPTRASEREAFAQRLATSRLGVETSRLGVAIAGETRHGHSLAIADANGLALQSGFRYHVEGNSNEGFRAVPTLDPQGSPVLTAAERDRRIREGQGGQRLGILASGEAQRELSAASEDADRKSRSTGFQFDVQGNSSEGFRAVPVLDQQGRPISTAAQSAREFSQGQSEIRTNILIRGAIRSDRLAALKEAQASASQYGFAYQVVGDAKRGFHAQVALNSSGNPILTASTRRAVKSELLDRYRIYIASLRDNVKALNQASATTIYGLNPTRGRIEPIGKKGAAAAKNLSPSQIRSLIRNKSDVFELVKSSYTGKTIDRKSGEAIDVPNFDDPKHVHEFDYDQVLNLLILHGADKIDGIGYLYDVLDNFYRPGERGRPFIGPREAAVLGRGGPAADRLISDLVDSLRSQTQLGQTSPDQSGRVSLAPGRSQAVIPAGEEKRKKGLFFPSGLESPPAFLGGDRGLRERSQRVDLGNGVSYDPRRGQFYGGRRGAQVPISSSLADGLSPGAIAKAKRLG